MSPKLIVGCIGILVGCWGLSEGADFLLPGAKWPAFVALVAIWGFLLVKAYREGRLKNI